MKTIYYLLALIICLNGYAQTSNFKNDYEKFLENQKMPLLKSNEEFVSLDGTIWERPYGEKEYSIPPSVLNISEYSNRVKSSKFHFINVEITEKSKTLLNKMNIYVPDYIDNNVNVYLPEIDIDELVSNNIYLKYLSDYGMKKGALETPEEPMSIIYSDDFEGVFPDNIYTTYINGISNCGWDDVSCANHSGSWSVWCAATGAACNACGGWYVNNMNSGFYKTSSINTSAYKDLMFKYWIWIDLNDAETTDFLRRWQWLGSSFVIGATFYSNHTFDEAGWSQGIISYQGIYQDYNFQFQMWSDGSLVSDGAYIDDVELSGTIISSIEDINYNNNVSVFPNPSNGTFSIILNDEKQASTISIENVLGEKILETKDLETKNIIDMPKESNGIYFLKVYSEKDTLTKKIIINK